jgi:cell wall-associated NlpC family hydrolase
MPFSINLLFENDVFKTLQNYFRIRKAQNYVAQRFVMMILHLSSGLMSFILESQNIENSIFTGKDKRGKHALMLHYWPDMLQKSIPYFYRMKTILISICALSILILTGCSTSRKTAKPAEANSADILSKVVIKNKVPVRFVNTKEVSANDLVDFAETLIGIKYKYGSTIKEKGFDCSGFINYVFNHFKISVPRSSVDFTNAGTEVPVKDSKPGDLILFTGSDANSGVVGHMGIITENKRGELQFIHASESRGVMISGMNSYFLQRFVKVNRVFTIF